MRFDCVFIVLRSTRTTADMSNMGGCLQVVRIYSFKKEIKVFISASYFVFLIVKKENNSFIKEIKHILRTFLEPGENFRKVCEKSGAGENLRLRLGFSLICSRILPKVCRGFHQLMHVLFLKC